MKLVKNESIDVSKLELGNIAFNNYTNKLYIVTILPNIICMENDIYALVRLDGHGYYYKSKSLDELKRKIELDCGETEIYKNLIVNIEF